MLYEKNKEKELSSALFKNPTAEYRSTPFWAWNSNLNREELARQIEVFSEMGFGGFHMHVRQGLESEYLGEDFLGAVRFCTDKAKDMGMLAWLYDEDRWPSGVAGGKVTKAKRHRQKFLTMSVNDRENCASDAITAAEVGLPYFLASFIVEIDEEGKMTSYRRVERFEDNDNPGKRYFFIEQKQGGEPRYNYQAYVDTLSKEAIDEFINTTHESFKLAVGDEFGKAVPAIFTDEPQMYGAHPPRSGFDRKDSAMSWTTDFAETYRREFGEDIIGDLPLIFYATDIEAAYRVRYNYYSHLSERFSSAYLDNIADWCEKNGLALTGHVIGEDALYETALDNADVMRAYRKMQIPGIDILCDDIVYNTPIQCRSVMRQYGREAMMTELYGVTGWDFDFRGHKYQGDWQACLGATVRVPHLAWQSMKGEGKRDYPATISYQSAWFREYKYIEDHYARINTALTRGKPDTNIALLYPIDSYNILYASVAETLFEREEMDKNYKDITEWLLAGGFEFDNLSESLLPELTHEGGCPLAVGKMKYDVVVVPDSITLRPHTVKALSEFIKCGGKVVFIGKTPYMIGGVKSADAKALAEAGIRIPVSKKALYEELSSYRKVDIRDESGARTKNLMYTMRVDGDSRWVFLAHLYKPELPHLINGQKISVSLKGRYKARLYDTLSGEISDIPCEVKGDKTVFYKTLYDLDTLLVRLDPVVDEYANLLLPSIPKKQEIPCPSKVDYALSEPNALVLDMARFSLDGAPLSEYEEEIMRIDANVRDSLGLRQRRTKVVQPWAIEGSPEDHTVMLSYTVRSDIELEGAFLAMENPEKAVISLNSVSVSNIPVGYYVDRDIKTVALPKIPIGESRLEISIPFGLRTDLEACYIVGSFGTSYVGREAKIVRLPEKLHFGSVVNQGLAFYGGNIEYRFPLHIESPSELEFTVSHYRAALVGVAVDGEDIGRIAFPPFTLKTDKLTPGDHNITLTLFGTRYNTFSAIHNLNASKKRIYMGPDFWRSENEAWAYEYQTREMGILKTPVIKVISKDEN